MVRFVSLIAAGVAAVAMAPAEDGGSIVIRHATEAVLVNGSELPKAGIGFWRLEPGSTVESKGGFVELAVGEGAWLRLRPDTRIKLAAETESAIELDIERGTVILDALHDPEKAVALRIDGSSLQPGGKGSYLVETEPARFAALKGKASVETGSKPIELKSKTFVAGDGSGGAQKLDKLEEGAFETWREERNREIILEERRAATFAERTMRPAR